MNRINEIWATLNGLTSDVQVMNYWESRQHRILEILRTADSDFEIATKIIHKLAKSLNEKEKYSSVYFLYQAGYLRIEHKLIQSDEKNELKFELGRGLHHNRKYEHSKRLFNELASENFEVSRIDGWWNQSAYAGTREKIWIKTG